MPTWLSWPTTPTSIRDLTEVSESYVRSYDFLVTYKEYIKTFQWNTLKYSTKRSLMELTAVITKNMRQSDEQIKKNLEEQSSLKQKITSMTKKDQGNLQVRDYTDDIYNKNPSKDLFVETHGSDLFVNMLVVLN